MYRCFTHVHRVVVGGFRTCPISGRAIGPTSAHMLTQQNISCHNIHIVYCQQAYMDSSLGDRILTRSTHTRASSNSGTKIFTTHVRSSYCIATKGPRGRGQSSHAYHRCVSQTLVYTPAVQVSINSAARKMEKRAGLAPSQVYILAPTAVHTTNMPKNTRAMKDANTTDG